jgi:hypothetical protein
MGTEQGVGASNSPPLARLGDEHTCPFRSQMAKVELQKLFGKSQARANLLTISRIIAA